MKPNTLANGVIALALVALIAEISYAALTLRDSNGETSSAATEYPWCHPYRWIGTEQASGCQIHIESFIPTPINGECPTGFTVWVYRPSRPAICVRNV